MVIKNCEANDNNIPEYIAKDIKKELDGEWICVFNSNDNINDFWFSEDNCYDYIKIMLNNYKVIINNETYIEYVEQKIYNKIKDIASNAKINGRLKELEK